MVILEFAGGQIQLEVLAAEGVRVGVVETLVLLEVPVVVGWVQLGVVET